MYNRRRQQSRFPAAAADQGETRRQHDTRARGTYVRTHNNIRRHRHGRHTAYYYHRAVAGRRPLSSHGRGATPRTGRREGAAADRRSPPTAGAAHYRRRDRENDKQHALAPNNVHDNSPPPPRRRRLAHTHTRYIIFMGAHFSGVKTRRSDEEEKAIIPRVRTVLGFCPVLRVGRARARACRTTKINTDGNKNNNNTICFSKTIHTPTET